MSNKKRIYKKIKHIETRSFSKSMKSAYIAGFNAGDLMKKLVSVVELNTDILRKTLLKRKDFIAGRISKELFIQEVKKLTPLDHKSIVDICKEIPCKLHNDYKGLLIAGFDAHEALELLKETYKF